MGSYPVIVPVSPGVLCAMGDATTQMRYEHARSFNKTITKTNNEEIARWLEDMQEVVMKDLEEEGIARADQIVKFEAGVRYRGQGFEVDIPIELDDFKTSMGLEILETAFNEEHERLFTFNLDVEHEIVNLRAVAIGQGRRCRPRRFRKATAIRTRRNCATTICGWTEKNSPRPFMTARNLNMATGWTVPAW